MKWVACGKITYETQFLARAALRTIKRTSHRSHIPKREYYCGTCKGWHLTSNNKRA